MKVINYTKPFNNIKTFVECNVAFKNGVTIGCISLDKEMPKKINWNRLVQNAKNRYWYEYGEMPPEGSRLYIEPYKTINIVYIYSPRYPSNNKELKEAFEMCLSSYKSYRSLLHNGREFASLKEEKDFLQSMYNLYGDDMFHTIFTKPFRNNIFFMAFERAVREEDGSGNIPSAKHIFSIYYKICKRNGLWLENK